MKRAQWAKLRSVRSTYWTLLVAAAGMVGFGALLCAAYVRHYTSETATPAGFDPAAYSLSGFFLAQLAVGTLGVVDGVQGAKVHSSRWLNRMTDISLSGSTKR